MMIYSRFSSFLRRTGNKKGASEKGSFVRIKGLRLSFQYLEYQSNNLNVNLLHTLWRCMKSVDLHKPFQVFQCIKDNNILGIYY